MFYFKKVNHNISPIHIEIAQKRLRGKIAKKHTLWATNTSTWVIFPERLFVGKENKDGSITIARFRKPIFNLFPKIYTNWILSKGQNKTVLQVKHSLSWLSFLGIWILSLNTLVFGIIGQWLTPKTFIMSIIVLTIAVLLILRECKINEQLILKIVSSEG